MNERFASGSQEINRLDATRVEIFFDKIFITGPSSTESPIKGMAIGIAQDDGSEHRHFSSCEKYFVAGSQRIISEIQKLKVLEMVNEEWHRGDLVVRQIESLESGKYRRPADALEDHLGLRERKRHGRKTEDLCALG